MYNGAALRGGGGLQATINRLEGGWADDYQTSKQFNTDARLVWMEMQKTYNISPATFRKYFEQGFLFDDLLMKGDPQMAYELSKTWSPEEKKLIKYIRTKAHRYGTEPQRFSVDEMKDLRDQLERERVARRERLRKMPYLGSNPFTGTKNQTARNYMGLFSKVKRPTVSRAAMIAKYGDLVKGYQRLRRKNPAIWSAWPEEDAMDVVKKEEEEEEETPLPPAPKTSNTGQGWGWGW